MLPFLKVKKDSGVAGLIMKNRSPDAPPEDKDSIDACAQDLISAVHAKDAKATAEALRSAFRILDSEPHEEGEHTNKPSPHTYEAQNKAAKQQE